MLCPSPAVVTGYQQPSGAAPGHACQFYISLLDTNHKEQRLDENGEDRCPLSGNARGRLAARDSHNVHSLPLGLLEQVARCKMVSVQCLFYLT